MAETLGLDIGGANIKAAHSSGACHSRPFALWKNPAGLPEVLREVARALPDAQRLAVTMTAELCDCFETKAHGVTAILDAAQSLAQGRPVHVWLTDGRFADVEAAMGEPLKAAASNWHAQATFLAQQSPSRNLVLVDTGSTTTDIIPIAQGRVVARGLTDMARLGTRELVYLGADRTPLMALGGNVWFDDHSWSVMAERFATMDDAMLVLGMADETADDTDASDDADTASNGDTADGRPRTRQYAAARLVRMIGADSTMLSESQVRALAESFVDTAVQMIANGVIRSLVPLDGKVDAFVISGSGAALADLAVRRARPDVATERLADVIGQAASAAACAHAVVQLLDHEPALR